MKTSALIVGYLAVLVNIVYVLCVQWFDRNPSDDFMGGFVALPYIICWPLSIPTALAAFILAVIALVRSRSWARSAHALVIALVACVITSLAHFS